MSQLSNDLLQALRACLVVVLKIQGDTRAPAGSQSDTATEVFIALMGLFDCSHDYNKNRIFLQSQGITYLTKP